MVILTLILTTLSVCMPTSELELSFEGSIKPASAHMYSTVSVSDEHFKIGEHSLRWKWGSRTSRLSIKVPVPYLAQNPNPNETSISTFVFWVYSAEPRPGALTFTFCKQGRDCCHFDFRLGFTGWRGGWVAFDRDMMGVPEEEMDEIVITSSLPYGTLYFDGIIPAVFEDARHHCPDMQLPFVNRGTDVHWLRLLEHWNSSSRPVINSEMPDSLSLLMETIRQRYISLVIGECGGIKRPAVEKFLSSFDIRINRDGSIKGKPLFFTRYAETYRNLGIYDMQEFYKNNGMILKDYCDKMFRIAASWLREPDGEYKNYLAHTYVLLTRHLLDQGLACGSGMGTIHHLGYSVRNWYNAQVIMMPVLRDAGLLDKIQQAVEWYAGTREVWSMPSVAGMDVDALNTYLFGRIASVLLLPDDEYKYSYMKALSAWIDNGFEFASGLGCGFHPDGTVFHHRRNYPAYAIGGFEGAVRAVLLLRNTPFAISEKGYNTLKNAMMQMKFYCCDVNIPYAMSGRHPEGSFTLNKNLYMLLANADSPDNRYITDSEIISEVSEEGCRSYGYNSSVSVRHGNWLVNIAGHSRYLWATETYPGQNMYGRYLTHGSMQYMSGSPEKSGYMAAGWDWRHIPGTTAAEIPMPEMRANVLNVDTCSGYEEMLLSDEWFAGGAAFGDNAVYSMILHEHDKYNGSLRAYKSYFIFGNKIVCLGSGLENHLDGSRLHTTLFQNGLSAPSESILYVASPAKCLKDHLGNAFIVRSGGDVVYRRSLQQSMAEDDSGPNEGWFELAYIDHGDDVTDGRYEYLFLVQPDSTQVESAVVECPYEVLHSDNTLHAVREFSSGVIGASVFEGSRVDDFIEYCSPCVLLQDGKRIHFAHPDLALYEGPADEVYDSEGNRVERSIYSRHWIDNPCADVKVTMHFRGNLKVKNATCVVESIEYKNGLTMVVLITSEAKTETIEFETIDE